MNDRSVTYPGASELIVFIGATHKQNKNRDS